MPGENCMVCASDEGIFLDVLEQPTLRGKARNCRLEKLSENSPTTKVCHKCAFEIEQCNIFVDKIKKANKIQISRKGCCILCLDTYNKEIFFDLSKEKIGVNNLVHKIRDLFPDELKFTELQKQLICLSCRYCVDLLNDLRNVSNEVPTKLKTIIQNGIDPADLPKTKTSIVNRKTTFIQSSNLDLNTPSDTDSDSSSVMNTRKRIKVNKTLIVKSQRKCEKCKTEVKSGVDMYKIYRTGVTVCKHCWLTIDPGKTKTPSKKRKKIDYSETKLCSVLLEDVYQKNPNEREYKIEKDNKGNTIFIVTDDSESETRTRRKTNKTNLNEVENKQEEIKESIQDVGIKKTKPARGGRKKDENEKSTQEIVETKLTKSNSRRKESEQSLQGDFEVKSNRNRWHKESEQNVQEDIEIKSTRSSRKRKDSEESIQEPENKFSKSRGIQKDSEQSIQEKVELKTTRTIRRRKDSEESLQDIEVQSIETNRNRNDSDQSILEIVEAKSTKSIRWRKESEQSSQESEGRSTRSGKNRRDSEQSSQESVVVISTRGDRRRKDSEQSAQEDIEVNVDVDSDSTPVFKKAKKSNAKVESMPKQIQSKISNQNSAVSEVVFARKRGRSSSIESTGSLRRSVRNAKKNSQELEEIIEIDDDSNSFKIQKENELINENILMHESKRCRTDRQVSCDEHSDTESNASDIKIGSKRSSSVSSKESTPISKFKAPPNKDHQENINLDSLKFASKEIKFNKFERLKIGKSDDVESIKSIEVDTSESEEIDVLKSTDEETKDDTIEIETKEKDNSTLLSLEKSIYKIGIDNNLKLNKDIIEPADDEETNSVDENNSKCTEKNVDSTNDVFKKTQSEIIEKISKSIIKENENSDIEESVKLDIETNKLNLHRDFKLVKPDIFKSAKEERTQKHENESIEKNVAQADTDVKKDTVVEIVNDSEKEIIVADLNDMDINLSEDNSDYSISESLKEKLISGKRSLLNAANLRKSKSFSSRKSKKNKNKNSADDIIVYDSSDSEFIKNIEQTELTYTCTICDKIYENKFIGLQHELTHMKTLEIKLRKVEIPEKNKSFYESDIEEVSSKEEYLHSNLVEKTILIDNNKEKNENNTENQEPPAEKEYNEDKLDIDMQEETGVDNEQIEKESSIKNIIIDTTQISKDQETFNNLSEIQENIEENGKENGEVILNNSVDEKVEYTDNERENELEITNRRSPRRLSKKIEMKCDKKSRGKRKSINENDELEEVAISVEYESDKIAEAVQETLNDMAELHGKIQESTPAKVPELNKTEERESENNTEIPLLKMDNENKNDVRITQSSEEKECSKITDSDIIQRIIQKSKEEAKYQTDDEEQEIENNSITEDVKDDSSKEIIETDNEVKKQTNENVIKITQMDDAEPEPIKSITNVDCQQIDLNDNNECKLSKAENVIETEEVIDSSETVVENKSSIASIIGINIESVAETDITKVDKLSLENDNSNLNKPENDTDDMINEDDDNNTEDEEALAQESLEELLQRKGLQIIDEFAESVTDGDEESEKDVNMSSEKENVSNKEVELDNELQIKISDAECTDILEINNKSLPKQKEVEHNVVGESQIIQDVDVVEEVINDDDQPHGDVVQEVEVESNVVCFDFPALC